MQCICNVVASTTSKHGFISHRPFVRPYLCAFIWTSVFIQANFLFWSVQQLGLNKQAALPCCQSRPVNYNQAAENVHIPPFAHRWLPAGGGGG